MDVEVDIPYHVVYIVPLAELSGGSVAGTALDVAPVFSRAMIVNDVIGGRLTFFTPFGLKFGGSFNQGKLETAVGEGSDDFIASAFSEGVEEFQEMGVDKITCGAHLVFDYRFLNISSEYLFGEVEEQGSNQIVYGEVSVRFLKKWQLAGRYDYNKGEIDNLNVGSLKSILEHYEWAFGINYWFNPNFVLRASCHLVEGNKYAMAESIDDIIANGLDEETRLIVFGTQFSF